MHQPIIADSQLGFSKTGKLNRKYFVVITLIAAFGGFLFGFDFSVISGGIEQIREYFNVGPGGEGFLVASLYLGCIIGSGLSGIIGNKLGKKFGLTFSAILFAISCVGIFFSENIYVFVLYRFFGGLGVGLASALSPLYLAEIAPDHIRGRLVTVNQLSIVLGIFITYFSNYFILTHFANDPWRWMFGVGSIPSFLFFISSLLIPESPRWLMLKGKSEDALNILLKLGDNEYADMQFAKLKFIVPKRGTNFFNIKLNKSIRKILLIGITIAIFQQLCGINNIFVYAPKIFASVGLNAQNQLYQTVFIGLINLFSTILVILFVDKWGRRRLLLAGTTSLVIAYLLIGLFFIFSVDNNLILLFLMLFAIASYAISLAPVTWIILSEIFPANFREYGMSISVFSLWLSCFLVLQTFPVLVYYLSPGYTFLMFTFICLLGFLFIYYNIPETKNKSLEEIEKLLIT